MISALPPDVDACVDRFIADLAALGVDLEEARLRGPHSIASGSGVAVRYLDADLTYRRVSYVGVIDHAFAVEEARQKLAALEGR